MYNPGQTKWIRSWDHPRITSFFNPLINRHSGQPHEHKREIARRARRSANS